MRRQGSLFLTRQERIQKTKRKVKLPLEELHSLGLTGVRDMNPSANTVHMKPTGSAHPDVYILGEAPGELDDIEGKQFVGKSGRLLRKMVPGDRELTWDNCCRTKTPTDRTPTHLELECYRPTVEESIAKAKPKVILAVGSVPFQWAMKNTKYKIKAARGRAFPIRVKGHVCWLCPILHPSLLLRFRDSKFDGIDGREWEKVTRKDILKAFEMIEIPCPEPDTEDQLEDNVRILMREQEVHDALASLKAEEAVSWDLETNALRPYKKGAKILSWAFAGVQEAFSFPFDWGNHFDKEARERILDSIWDLFESKPLFIAHNLNFELEWLCEVFKTPDAARLARWYDTMQAAYILDSRRGGHSLDFLCRQYLGLALKTFSGVGKYMEAEPMRKVLRYNAMDAKYTLALYRKVTSEVAANGLEQITEEQIRRVPTVVLTQWYGHPIDTQEVRKHQEHYEKEIAKLEEEMAEREEAQLYMDSYGAEFNMGSQRQVGQLLEILGHAKTVKNNNGAYRTGVEILEPLQEKEPIAEIVLDYRRCQKLLGTYLARFLTSHEDSLVYPDGKLHPQFHTIRTETGRLASSDPNGQNWPKRKDWQIRSIVKAPKGHTLVSIDFGQIEARVIAMITKDKKFTQAIREGYDIHMEWAEKIAKAHPPALKKRGDNMKKLRQDVKSAWSFLLFFGGSYKKAARMLDMHEDVALKLSRQFWEEFKGVKAWHQRITKFYNDKGYVSTLTGRRRYAPLSYNMIINTPIQGTASDIVVDAMCRLSEIAEEEEKPYLQPILNIHDDLTFIIPDAIMDETVERIVQEMLHPKYDWLTVPLSVEVEAGKDWANMEGAGEFTS